MASKKEEELAMKWAKIIAKAWSDPAFKQKLLKNPQQVLTEHGISVPARARVVIEEDSDEVFHLFLPKKPEGHLSENELKKAAGAWACTPQFLCG